MRLMLILPAILVVQAAVGLTSHHPAIRLASTNASGDVADAASVGSFASLDLHGTHVAFISPASNFGMPSTKCGKGDLPCIFAFVKDLDTGRLATASVNSAGLVADNDTWHVRLAPDAGSVLEATSADNLAPTHQKSPDYYSVRIDLHSLQAERADLGFANAEPRTSEKTKRPFGCAHYCGDPSMDGRANRVVFSTWSTDMWPGDGNDRPDVFVRDLAGGYTLPVSVSTKGQLGNDASYLMGLNAISGDGLRVVFTSVATDLAAAVPSECSWAAPSYGANPCPQVYLRDLQKETTSLVSRSTAGSPGNAPSFEATISGNGKFVAFRSDATDLTPGLHARSQVYWEDLETGELRQISMAENGSIPDQGSSDPVLSDDGQLVAFVSSATNLAGEPANGKANIFVHDVRTGKTQLVSETLDGEGLDADSVVPSISGDGQIVAFTSKASQLPGSNGMPQVYVVDLSQFTPKPAPGTPWPLALLVLAGLVGIVRGLKSRRRS